MPTGPIFLIQMILGYVAWLLCFGAYGLPRLRSMDSVQAHRAIATLHGFRFFGLVFVLPGFVGPHLPAAFAAFAAQWDFATGVLALLALLAFRIRPVFWGLVVAFNVTGVVDLVMDYAHAIRSGVPEAPGELGAAYLIPILYVPLLMITHLAAFRLMARAMVRRPDGRAVQA